MVDMIVIVLLIIMAAFITWCGVRWWCRRSALLNIGQPATQNIDWPESCAPALSAAAAGAPQIIVVDEESL